jgi:serine/threonine protein kinase
MAVKQLDAKEVSEKELAVLENELRLLIGQAGESSVGSSDGGGGRSSAIMAHAGLNHPNIVRYLGMEKTQVTLSIFLEYVPGGSIRSLIDRFGALQEPLVRVYTRQLLLGLEYLHRNGIAHRDIKVSC